MDTFSALSDSTRRNILTLLGTQGELSVNDILENFPISQPAISQHLKILNKAKLVKIKKQAQRRYYSIDVEGFSEVESWIQRTTQQWQLRFAALEKVLATEKLKAKK